MITSLYTAQSGLKTSRYSIDSTSNNIANENTEGYKKRVVSTSEVNIDGDSIGNGVSFDGANRTINKYLYSQIITQNSQLNYYEQENSTLSSIEMIFEETDTSGFSTTINDFFSSIENYRTTPSSSVYKQEFQSQSEIVVSTLQSLYTDIQEVKSDNSDLLEDQVDEINSILNEIVEINEKLQVNENSNDLLDKRDALEKELSNYANISVDDNSSNYNLYIGGERVIFNATNLDEISINKEYTAQKNIYNGTELNDLNFSDGDTISLTLNNTSSISITASVSGSSDYDLKQQIVDTINTNSDFSSLEAYLDTSNNLVIKSIDEGEDSYFDLKIEANNSLVQKSDISIEASDTVYLSAYGNDLNLSSGTTKSLTQSLTTETSDLSSYKKSLDDFAKALVETVNSSIETPLFIGADVEGMEFLNENINSLDNADLEKLAQIQWNDEINISSKTDDLTSFSEFYQDFLVTISSNVEDNSFFQDTQETVLNSLLTTYENQTKVDSDEEMINLIQYQAAYEANAKVITVVDEMLQTILDM